MQFWYACLRLGANDWNFKKQLFSRLNKINLGGDRLQTLWWNKKRGAVLRSLETNCIHDQRKSKVTQLHIVVDVIQNILRFDVAVHDAFIVQIVQGLGATPNYFNNKFLFVL